MCAYKKQIQHSIFSIFHCLTDHWIPNIKKYCIMKNSFIKHASTLVATTLNEEDPIQLWARLRTRLQHLALQIYRKIETVDLKKIFFKQFKWALCSVDIWNPYWDLRSIEIPEYYPEYDYISYRNFRSFNRFSTVIVLKRLFYHLYNNNC